MAWVTGIGGILFKARDPEALGAWYDTHLGVQLEDWGGTWFLWRRHDAPERTGFTVWSLFKQDSTYFDPGTKPFMSNYIVDDRIEESEYGRFGWANDPEGNRIELWELPETER